MIAFSKLSNEKYLDCKKILLEKTFLKALNKMPNNKSFINDGL